MAAPIFVVATGRFPTIAAQPIFCDESGAIWRAGMNDPQKCGCVHHHPAARACNARSRTSCFNRLSADTAFTSAMDRFSCALRACPNRRTLRDSGCAKGASETTHSVFHVLLEGVAALIGPISSLGNEHRCAQEAAPARSAFARLASEQKLTSESSLARSTTRRKSPIINSGAAGWREKTMMTGGRCFMSSRAA